MRVYVCMHTNTGMWVSKQHSLQIVYLSEPGRTAQSLPAVTAPSYLIIRRGIVASSPARTASAQRRLNGGVLKKPAHTQQTAAASNVFVQ